MARPPGKATEIKGLDLTTFATRLVGDLAAELTAVMGDKQAREVVSLVGLGMAEDLERAVAQGVVKDPEGRFSPDDVGKILVEVKRRIRGDFSVESASSSRLVLTNRRCPFGDEVKGRPALCKMTSSVFGGVAARHFGAATVEIEKAIARGDEGCRVTILLGAAAPKTRSPWVEHYRGPD
ncbi:MAG TPA: methanogen output domain 1-containing protein [Candidatus Thermoplasmatota archaeon]|nr:methanogen output domain 1-containing protein [Candidatus Thermoplasmatota archaeon]